jgi:hypothetical protein
MAKKRKSGEKADKKKFYDDVLKVRGFRLGLH